METLICPTCGCSLVRLGISEEKATKHSHDGKEYLFCCKGCADVFAGDPETRLQETKDLIVCPTCLAEKPPRSAVTMEHAGQEIHFCRCPHCLEVFRKAPDYYLKRLQGAEATRRDGDREPTRPGSDRDAVTPISRGQGDFDLVAKLTVSGLAYFCRHREAAFASEPGARCRDPSPSLLVRVFQVAADFISTVCKLIHSGCPPLMPGFGLPPV